MTFYTLVLIGSVLLLLFSYDPAFHEINHDSNPSAHFNPFRGILVVVSDPPNKDNCSCTFTTSSVLATDEDILVTSLDGDDMALTTDDDTPVTGRLNVESKTFNAIMQTDRVATWFFFWELLIRFLVCPYKINFLKDTFNIIDILAVLPWTVIVLLFQLSSTNLNDFLYQDWVQIYIKISGVLRVVRLINLARHYIASRVFLITVWESRKEMMLLLSLYISGATFFAVATFYCEQGNNEQFPSMAAGIWWAIITMSTVGYGDITPKTEMGKTIGVMCAFSGVICTALPVAVIATNYNIIYKTAKVRAKLRNQLKVDEKTQ